MTDLNAKLASLIETASSLQTRHQVELANYVVANRAQIIAALEAVERADELGAENTRLRVVLEKAEIVLRKSGMACADPYCAFCAVASEVRAALEPQP